LQTGMIGLREYLSFENFPADSITGRIELLFLGVVFTIITQSSSAGVATTMTALYASQINFEQATALIIGMDLGTAFKAVIATIGANLEARRTGFSHVIYNMFTAAGAFLLVTPYIYVCELIAPGELLANPEIGLVLFHTSYNTLGVIAAVPFAHQFASLILKIFPDKRVGIAKYIDPGLLKDPVTALDVVQKYIPQHLTNIIQRLSEDLSGTRNTSNIDQEVLLYETEHIIDFIEKIHLESERKTEWVRLVNCIHVMDHVDRLLDRATEIHKVRDVIGKNTKLMFLHKEYRDLLLQILELISENHWDQAETLAKKATNALDKNIKMQRQEIIQQVSVGKSEIPEATLELDHIRSLKRLGHHITKILHHYNQMLLSNAEEQT